MFITGLQLLTADLKATTEFYSSVLGLQVSERTESSVSIQAGYSTITFLESVHSKPCYHFAFNIPPDKLDEAYKWSSARFQIFDIESYGKIAGFPAWNARSFYFSDPAGNVLELIARSDLDEARKEGFDGNFILGVSEIGIPVTGVKEAFENVCLEYNLRCFERQRVLDNFAAAGDDHGLLIFVEEGKLWYPTQIPAIAYPCRIEINDEHGMRTIAFG